MSIMNKVKREARSLGIDMVACTSLYRSEFIGIQLEARRQREMDTEFDKVNVEDRIYPNRLLKNWKSIISFGLSYNLELENTAEESSEKGILSRCSMGVDYHKVLGDRIEALMNAIREEYSFDYRIGVDTTPLLDREIAYLSGIGYQGKNTNIINDYYGSFIFLGYALVDIELKDYSYSRDDVLSDAGRCGECGICQKACPTSSINGDYTINARSCLAYITQTKTKIPYNLRYKMANRIYGCDTCQEVCPKNKGVFVQSREVFSPIYVDRAIDLEALAGLTNKEFRESYGKTSSGWRGKNILRRNAIIAMGNTLDKKYLKLLETLLADASDMIKEYSMWSILNIDLDHGILLFERNIKNFKQEVKDEVDKMIIYVKENKPC